jgi:RNA polymerase sigma-70 factor (ECF subfamily)
MADQIDQIWCDFSGKLRNYICKHVKDQPAAEDILQEVFIRIHLNLHQVKDPLKLTSWIFSIARNEVNNHFRAMRNPAALIPETEEEEKSGNHNDNFSEDVIPFIHLLPPHYREVLLLAEFENLSQTEIARRLGITYTCAKSRVQRAREKLRELFEDCCEISTDRFGNIVDYKARPCSQRKKTCR